MSLVAVLTETEGVLSAYLTPTLEFPTPLGLAGSWSGEPFAPVFIGRVPITRQVFLAPA